MLLQSFTPASLCAVQLLLGRTATGAGGSSEVLAAKLANTLCGRAIKTLPAILQQVRALAPLEQVRVVSPLCHSISRSWQRASLGWLAPNIHVLSTSSSKTAGRSAQPAANCPPGGQVLLLVALHSAFPCSRWRCTLCPLNGWQ